jgi:hypothetical protein
MLLPNRTRAGWLSRAAGRPAAMPHLMPYFRVQSHLSPPQSRATRARTGPRRGNPNGNFGARIAVGERPG